MTSTLARGRSASAGGGGGAWERPSSGWSWSLRRALRAATNLPDAMFMDWRGERYQLDAGLIDADVWRLQAALRDVVHSSDDVYKARALEHVGGVYKGEFLEGAHYDLSRPSASIRLPRNSIGESCAFM